MSVIGMSLRRAVWLLLLLALAADNTQAQQDAQSSTPVPSALTPAPKKNKCENDSDTVCKDSLILSAWKPVTGITTGERIARAVVYFACLAYMFLGVSIIADRFMSSIEVITSKEKVVKLKRITGEEYTVLVRVWNETVSNLTLMALGSSAPEILLSIIEIVGNDFEAGALGPSTIVGSAAFNFYIIIGICVYVIPSPDIRRVKHIYVFWVTAVWSVFAYIWLYMILAVISPGEVTWVEGLITFLYFPLTVLTAYLADRQMFGIFGRRFMSRPQTAFTASQSGRADHPDKAEAGVTNNLLGRASQSIAVAAHTGEHHVADEYENHRTRYIEIFKRLRAEHPDAPIETLEQMAEQEAIKSGPKSRAFYRIQATRKLVGAGDIQSKHKIQEHMKMRESASADLTASHAKTNESDVIKVYFDPGHYTCMENCGTVAVTVVCERINCAQPSTVQVEYNTADGSAKQKSDYVASQGLITFKPQEKRKQIHIEIIDNDIFEEDEEFAVHLSNPKIVDEVEFRSGRNEPGMVCKLSTPFVATVLIVDNDHAGQFQFDNEQYTVAESDMMAQINVMRIRGARGTVGLPYKTIDGTAKSHKDYTPTSGMLMFKNEQTEARIQVRIVNDDEYEKSEDFYVELGEPIWYDHEGRERKRPDEGYIPDPDDEDGEAGRPVLGKIAKAKVVIKESKEFKNFVDKMLASANTSVMVGTSSWKQQFVEAVSVEGSGEEEDDDGAAPGFFDYVMHALTMPWKLLFALVPPTDYFGGWLCFVVSISAIGVMTALIGDLASQFGCTVGLKDSVNALTLVALGTSLPDTFASKTAAINDDSADSSIGNVTGSNAVNVFLGIGIAWLMAAVVHNFGRGDKFNVDPGSLAFSVSLFCCGAVLLIGMLQLRRHLGIFGKGELGGPKGTKLLSSAVFIGTWVIYCTLSALEAYCIIEI